ncbi:hypothetical protein FEAC_12940 [Ferrimicrobium acidiphilum DSM 19497]|jgi:hypothetical protein|uniref:Uncharacterized protein n=1 Tax=Ferrimicrobium acidiphilum DSM 19497 TaxID=1121877 RepID=A0A0D8FVI8_9ACTN|nr:hypothetical protein FEAC_12940 [Ferrimicrobium acidiphilum DSM 19497]
MVTEFISVSPRDSVAPVKSQFGLLSILNRSRRSDPDEVRSVEAMEATVWGPNILS